MELTEVPIPTVSRRILIDQQRVLIFLIGVINEGVDDFWELFQKEPQVFQETSFFYFSLLMNAREQQ